MTPEPIEPRALAWVEAGVSGLARRREWDALQVLELPELADRELAEARFGVLADGTVVAEEDDLPAELLERLTALLAPGLQPPFEAVLARQTRLSWTLAGRELRIEELELPAVEATEIVVAVPPGGAPTLLVDGAEPTERSEALGRLAGMLEAAGHRRYRHFVVRARRTVGQRFALSIDPL